MSGSTVKNHIWFKTGFRYSATRRTSFRSWFQACHRVLPPVFPLQHLWHLQRRRLIILRLPPARLLHQPQLCQVTWDGRLVWDRFPSSANVKFKAMLKRWLNGETRCVLKNSQKIFVDDRVLEHRESHASSSHEVSLEPTSMRCEDLGKHSVFFLISLKTEIARSVRGPKLEGLRAEDAMAEPYFVQKFWCLVNSRSHSSQWRLWISNQSPICSRGAGLGHSMDPVVSV